MNYKIQNKTESWVDNILKPAIAGGLSMLAGKYYFTGLGNKASVLGMNVSKDIYFAGIGVLSNVINDIIMSVAFDCYSAIVIDYYSCCWL